MSNRTAPGDVQINITICLPSDTAACQQVLEGVTAMVAQLNAVLQPQVVVEYGPAKGGRPRLTDREWEERFATVERIISAKESLDITLKQACAR
ncbi:MAG: hypothetical protein JW900_14035, partial [Anaerolineae bacterium]|nr:hypothetical protein [Anaerolineae bacterium]